MSTFGTNKACVNIFVVLLLTNNLFNIGFELYTVVHEKIVLFDSVNYLLPAHYSVLEVQKQFPCKKLLFTFDHCELLTTSKIIFIIIIFFKLLCL